MSKRGKGKGSGPGKDEFFRINTQGGLAPIDSKPKSPSEENKEKEADVTRHQNSVIENPNTNSPRHPQESLFQLEDEIENVDAKKIKLDSRSLREREKEETENEPTPLPDLREALNAEVSEAAKLLSDLKPAVENIARLNQPEALTQDHIEILKKYISLKEKEVADLKEQHRQYQAFWKKLNRSSEELSNKNRELLGELDSLKRQEDQFKAEIHSLHEKHQGELTILKNDYDDQLKKSGNFQEQMQELLRQKEQWKEKVRDDLKRIKLKEKELENRYELLKRDTQTLLDSKDRHVLELKKKNDALELELETLEERLRGGNVILETIESKKRRLIETMKLAISLLEDIDSAKQDGDKRKIG